MMDLEASSGTNLSVGDDNCSYVEICEALSESDAKKWIDVARKLHIPQTLIASIEHQRNSGLLTFRETYHRIIEGWRGSFSSEAKLGKLLQALDQCDLNTDILRQNFGIPIPPQRKREGILFGFRTQAHSCITRENELEEVHKNLEDETKHPNMKSVVITGLGGIGKSTLCRQYIEANYGISYQDVVWIVASNIATIENTFRTLSNDKRVGTNSKTSDGNDKEIDTVVEEVFVFFSKRRKALFVFDNVERIEDIVHFLPSRYSTQWNKLKNRIQPQVLITSRISHWLPDQEDQYLLYTLIGIEKESAVAFLQSGFANNVADAEELVEILSHKTLQCFPLALHQAKAYIAYKQIYEDYPIQKYIEEYKNAKKNLLQSEEFRAGKAKDFYEYTTYTTWHITIEAILKVNDLSIKLFHVMSFLNPDKMEWKMFTEMGDSETALRKAINVLVQFSMISTDSKGQQQSILSIHRLVQDVTREKLKEGNQDMTVLKTALGLVSRLDISGQLQHAAAVWSYASEHGQLINDFYHKSVYGRGEETPLHLLSNRDLGENSDAFKAIVTHYWNTYPYHVAISQVINASDNFDRTPAWIASVTGNEPVLEALINEQSAELDTKSNLLTFHADNNTDPFSNLGETPLHAAARNGHSGCVNLLVNANSNLKRLTNKSGRTPAAVAALYGRVKVVEILEPRSKLHMLHAKLLNKANDFHEFREYMNQLDPAERTQLLNSLDFNATVMQQATFQGHSTSLLKFLKENGADVVLQGCNGPLLCAAGYGNLEGVRHLCKLKKEGVHPLKNGTKSNWTPVQEACRRGNLDIVKYFLEEYDYEGIPIEHVLNIQGDQKTTPLITAAYHGKSEVVEYLLKKGAKVNLANYWGATPPITGALMGFFNCVELILESGQDIEMDLAKVPGNKNTILAMLGVSLLHLASAYDNLEIVKKLVEEKKVDVDMGKELSFTPLHFAVFFGSDSVTKYLVEKGADVNAKINIANVINCICFSIQNGPLVVNGENMLKVLKYVHQYRNILNPIFALSPGSICKLHFCKTEIHKLENQWRKVECSGYFRVLNWVLSIEFIKKYVVVILDFVHSNSKKMSTNVDLPVQGNEYENIKQGVGLSL